MEAFIAAVFFGILGSGYFLCGRKVQNWVALVSGALLCAFPYFVDGLLTTMIIGLVLSAAPFVISV